MIDCDGLGLNFLSLHGIHGLHRLAALHVHRRLEATSQWRCTYEQYGRDDDLSLTLLIPMPYCGP